MYQNSSKQYLWGSNKT